MSQVRQLIDDDTSIITSNCFAGRIMQDLGMKYNTPTLGLYFMYPDYIEFLQHLEYYLTEAKIQFVEHSKYPLGDERRADWTNKNIGILSDYSMVRWRFTSCTIIRRKRLLPNGIVGPKE